jgi:hypothetical protein
MASLRVRNQLIDSSAALLEGGARRICSTTQQVMLILSKSVPNSLLEGNQTVGIAICNLWESPPEAPFVQRKWSSG